MATIDILIARHGDKASEPKPKYPGDAIDEAVPLSEKGVKKSFEDGVYLIAPDYDHVIGTVSLHLRTMQTLVQMLRGGGYQGNQDAITDPRVEIEQKANIGLRGYNWRLPGAPNIKQDPEGYARFMLENHFLQRTGAQPSHPADWPAPVLAQLGYNLAGVLEDAVHIARYSIAEKGHERVLVAVVTHAPYIDSLGSVLLPANINPLQDGRVEFVKYPGHFAMGDFIHGSLTRDRNNRWSYTGTINIKGNKTPITDRFIEVVIDVLRSYLPAHRLQPSAKPGL